MAEEKAKAKAKKRERPDLKGVGSWAQIGNNSSHKRTQKIIRNIFYVI